MAEGLNRFLGDTPGRVIVKLLVLSLVVGFVMTVFGWTPYGVYAWVRNFIIELWYTGFDALGEVGQYLAIGAAVVIPIFIVLRLLSFRR